MLNIYLPTFLNDFFVILLSIVIEGIPFILIGALLSGLVELFLTPEKIFKLIPKNKFLGFTAMALLGTAIPVCECGNIPFARRMISKEVPHYYALTFLLAAPVFNPLVILATLAAFPDDIWISIWRIIFTFIVAVSVGYIISLLPQKEVVIENIDKRVEHCTHNNNDFKKVHSFFHIVGHEFVEMTGIFIFGASIATSLQMFVPADVVTFFNQTEWISILAMMVLAFVISICSNVDAFFALAYAQIFPMSSILAFLVFGPMIDIKAIPMLKTIFRWKPLFLIVGYAFVNTFLLSYIFFLLS